MKKLMMILALITSMNASAQWFVSGSAGVGYLDDDFQFHLRPSAGYEFNDRWAAGFGLGMGVKNSDLYGIFDPFVRFNCWNNGKFFFDVKGEAKVMASSDWNAANIGVVPSMRIAINENWQVAGDFGLFGVQDMDGDWNPAFGVTSTSVEVSAIYRF